MLGNRIQRARKASRLSISKLAEQIGLNSDVVKKYEANEITPSSDILIKLSDALNVRIEYFFRFPQITLEDIKLLR